MIISKKFDLEASHVLPNHAGPCGRLHGHSWSVEVSVSGEINKTTHMVLDYADISKVVNPLIAMLDHQHLNSFIVYPTAENIAVWFGRRLLLSPGLENFFIEVTISETKKTLATWNSKESVALLGSYDVSAEERKELESKLQNLWVPRAKEV
jgi:6-pyruvoyltetrahydropterin/6-carboxytetrahydropterin synthase